MKSDFPLLWITVILGENINWFPAISDESRRKQRNFCSIHKPDKRWCQQARQPCEQLGFVAISGPGPSALQDSAFPCTSGKHSWALPCLEADLQSGLKARAKKQQTETHVREMSRPCSQGVEWWRLRPLQTSCHRVLTVRRKDKEKNPKVSIKCRHSLWLMKKCWVKIQRPTNLQLQGENTEINWKKRKRSQVPEKILQFTLCMCSRQNDSAEWLWETSHQPPLNLQLPIPGQVLSLGWSYMWVKGWVCQYFNTVGFIPCGFIAVCCRWDPASTVRVKKGIGTMLEN